MRRSAFEDKHVKQFLESVRLVGACAAVQFLLLCCLPAQAAAECQQACWDHVNLPSTQLCSTFCCILSHGNTAFCSTQGFERVSDLSATLAQNCAPAHYQPPCVSCPLICRALRACPT